MLQRVHAPAPIESVREDMDDDNATVSTRTEDDPVHLAMHAVDRLSSDASDDMEEDEVLYPKQSLSTSLRGFATLSPRLTAATPTVSPIATGARRGSNPQTATPRHLGFTALPQPVTESNWTNAAQPPLLFGSGTGEAPSIWSTTHDSGISPNVNAAPVQPVSSPFAPPITSTVKSPIARPLTNNVAPVTPTDYDAPFQANSPSNFVSHAVRSSLSMPPYGLVPPTIITSPYVSYPQPLHPDYTYPTAHPDPYQMSRQYRDWVPPP